LWLAVVLAAAGLRLVSLGSLPFTVAEGRSALRAWSFAHGQVPADWPGSLLNASQAACIRLFGSGEAVGRLSPALAGTGLVAVLYLLRPWLGRRVALFAALLAALSPALVQDSRDAASGSWGALLAVCLLALVLRFRARRDGRSFILMLGAFCLGLTTDATF